MADTYIVAHRGASFCAPENTLSAFRRAIELGADGIETDVQVTADRKLVIHHNYSVDGTANATGKIADMTLEQLKTLDFGSHKGAEFAGERIATLDECLEVTRPLTLVNIELKAPVDQTVPYVEMVVGAVKAHDMVEQTVISAFDHSLLRQVKEVCPKLRVGGLTASAGLTKNPLFDVILRVIPADRPLAEITLEDLALPEEMLNGMSGIDIVARSPKAAILELIHSSAALLPRGATMQQAAAWLKQQEDLVSYVKGLDFKMDYLHPEYHAVLTDETLIPRLAALGVGVSPYTPDTAQELRMLYRAGCYSIITNRPDILLGMR